MDKNKPDSRAASRPGILAPSSRLHSPSRMSFGSIEVDTGAEPPSVVNATPSFASATARPSTSVASSALGTVNPPQDENEPGDWTPVTRRTSRTHQERSTSSRSKSMTNSASESDLEFTSNAACKMTSHNEIMAAVRRHESIAAELQAQLERKSTSPENESSEMEEPVNPGRASHRTTVEDVEDGDSVPSILADVFRPSSSRNKGNGSGHGNSRTRNSSLTKVTKDTRDSKFPMTPKARAVTAGRLAAGSFLDKALRGAYKTGQNPPPSDSSSSSSSSSSNSSSSNSDDSGSRRRRSSPRRSAKRERGSKRGRKMLLKPIEPSRYSENGTSSKGGPSFLRFILSGQQGKRFFVELFEFCFPVDFRNKQRKRLNRCFQDAKSVAAHVAEWSQIFNTIGMPEAIAPRSLDL